MAFYYEIARSLSYFAFIRRKSLIIEKQFESLSVSYYLSSLINYLSISTKRNRVLTEELSSKALQHKAIQRARDNLQSQEFVWKRDSILILWLQQSKELT